MRNAGTLTFAVIMNIAPPPPPPPRAPHSPHPCLAHKPPFNINLGFSIISQLGASCQSCSKPNNEAQSSQEHYSCPILVQASDAALTRSPAELEYFLWTDKNCCFAASISCPTGKSWMQCCHCCSLLQSTSWKVMSRHQQHMYT